MNEVKKKIGMKFALVIKAVYRNVQLKPGNEFQILTEKHQSK